MEQHNNKPQIKQIHGVEWICDWFVGVVDVVFEKIKIL